MPKRGSRKVQFEIKSFTVDQDEDGGWMMRVVMEGYLGSFPGRDSQVQGAIEEAKTQAPNVVVAAPLEPESAASGTVPADKDLVQIPLGEQAADNETNLPFAPVQEPDADADAPQPMLGPKGDHKPDLGDVKKRVRQTQGKGE